MPSLIPVPAGAIAAIVTYLEIVAPWQAPVSATPRKDLTLARLPSPDPSWYRALYRRIGAEWLWFSRLMMTAEQLAAVIRAPLVQVYALRQSGEDIGLLEMDWRQAPECEIAFFGLVPGMVGSGAGSWLMRQAQQLAFDEGNATRLWLHTCTLDHPAALPFYLRHGFRAFRREVEIAPDPRLTGDLPRQAAAFHPIIAPD
jgi:GNAT superfamily N-acetyltransferase